ncbi:MAG: ArnT family glycosyltransferase, partial [Armatimonadota bacterium]
MKTVATLISRLSRINHVLIYIFLFAFMVSLVFTFVIFPRMSEAHHVVLDPDQHGNLGFGLWRYHVFSYYPEREPTVERGPGYPALIAIMLAITHGWYPGSVQLLQCVLFAVLILVVFYIGNTLWNTRVALLSAVICSVHPLVFWYTSRIWIELTATALFTAIVAGVVYFSKNQSEGRAIVLGVLLGVAALWKSTFLPYVLLIPILLVLLPRQKYKLGMIVIVVFSAILVVAPWTIRNYRLTGKFIPVHSRLGFNLQVGDDLVDNINKSPLALPPIFNISIRKIYSVESTLPKHLKRYEGELALDRILTRRCLARYISNPGFLARKTIVNAWLFWSLGETPVKTMVVTGLLVPLAVLYFISVIIVWKKGQLRSILGVHVVMVLFYYLAHLPVEAIARYSVVLIPTMVLYVVAFVLSPWLGLD